MASVTAIPSNESEPVSAPARGGGHAVVAAFLGWTLDAFDFFVLVFVIPAIAKEFDRPIAHIAYTITLTLAFRPLGALIFGSMADRYGRRAPLMINVVLFALLGALSGLAPNYTTFLVVRALFGVAMGGEWGVGASLAMEAVAPGRRGLVSGVLQEGYAVGYLLAAAAYYLVFPRFGWRAMFFVGGLPALLALYIRSKVPESKAWQHQRPNAAAIRRAVSSNISPLIYLVVLMTAMNFISHGTQDMYPTFLQNQRRLAPRPVATIAIIYNLGALGGGLCFGHLSDRLGRRRTMLAAVIFGLALVPLWIFSHSLMWLTLGAFLMQFMVQGAWGVIPAHLTELSPGEVRGLFPGLAYQLGVLFASGIAWFEALLAARFDYATALATVAATAFVFAGVVIACGRERFGADFHALT
ncbi:MAG TPA: MFS transporter [Candidatus Binataceae bacterium]